MAQIQVYIVWRCINARRGKCWNLPKFRYHNATCEGKRDGLKISEMS